MKRMIIGALALCGAVVSAMAEGSAEDMLVSGQRWNLSVTNVTPEGEVQETLSQSYIDSEPETVGEMTCYRLMHSTQSGPVESLLLTAEGEKLYVVDRKSGERQLYMDFGMKSGDTETLYLYGEPHEVIAVNTNYILNCDNYYTTVELRFTDDYKFPNTLIAGIGNQVKGLDINLVGILIGDYFKLVSVEDATGKIIFSNDTAAAEEITVDGVNTSERMYRLDGTPADADTRGIVVTSDGRKIRR